MAYNPREIEEQATKFVLDHGGGPLVQVGHGRWLMPGGHLVVNDGWGPSCCECPAGVAGLKQRRQFHQAFYERIKKDFATYKNILAGHVFGVPRWDAGLYGEQPADHKNALRHLAKLAEEQKSAAAQLTVEIDADPAEVAERHREEARRRAERERESQRRTDWAEINSITL